MREYGKIKTLIWSAPKIRALSDDAKLLFIYLVACPHGNSIGCFVLPLGYVIEDMSWTSARVSATLRELLSNGLVDRDEHTRVVHISSWWDHNAIENPNVARSAMNSWEKLPDCPQKSAAARDLLTTTHRLDNGSVTVLERFVQQFRNNETDKEKEKEPEKEREPEAAAERHRSEACFGEWWEKFPRQRRGSKQSAWKSWKRIVASGVDPKMILNGLAPYLTSKDVAEGFASAGDVWLHKERWNDQPTQAGISNARPNPRQRPKPMDGWLQAIEDLAPPTDNGGGRQAADPLLHPRD